MAGRDWSAIAAEYIVGGESLRAIARDCAVPWSTLRDRARREDWASLRRVYLSAQTAGGDGSADQIFRVTDKLVQRAEELLDTSEEMGARELGELMRAIKNAKEIRMIRSALDEREQLARLRTLEEKAAGGQAEGLVIEFSPEAGEAAK